MNTHSVIHTCPVLSCPAQLRFKICIPKGRLKKLFFFYFWSKCGGEANLKNPYQKILRFFELFDHLDHFFYAAMIANCRCSHPNTRTWVPGWLVSKRNAVLLRNHWRENRNLHVTKCGEKFQIFECPLLQHHWCWIGLIVGNWCFYRPKFFLTKPTPVGQDGYFWIIISLEISFQLISRKRFVRLARSRHFVVNTETFSGVFARFP